MKYLLYGEGYGHDLYLLKESEFSEDSVGEVIKNIRSLTTYNNENSFVIRLRNEKGVSISNAKYNDTLHYLMSKYGFETECYGRSCFRTRNGVTYLTKNIVTLTIPVITIGYKKGSWNYDFDNPKIEYQEYSIYDNSDVKQAFEECQKEAERIKNLEAEKQILAYSKDGKVSVFESQDGSCGDTPYHPDWDIIWSVRTACTADHRQGLGHTYIHVYLHKGTQGTVKVTIPDKYKGMFIGKQGSNIKSLQEKYGVRFILK